MPTISQFYGITIRGIQPQLDFKLKIEYSNGDLLVSDFEPLIRQGGVFTALGDPDLFAQVQIGEHGRYIRWPDDLDFCADALWLEAHSLSNSA
ncbi:MAG: DUF2442 domain-containing protein, partial [Chloroflexia bacterium]